MPRHPFVLFVALVAGLWTYSGCSQETRPVLPALPAGSAAKPAEEETPYRLAREPAGAVGVARLRREARHQDQVVAIGRIGGSTNPWVEGRAAFLLVDPELQSCIDVGCLDCDKPWDFC
ncbi:MAG: hypothetical protein GTO03_07775 [Planctomycetales bacterium]|nr:hypothetical protein [Planctomycetales bacterium]